MVLQKYNRDSKDILYPKRGGGFRTIKAGSYFVNRHTPRGDDAELYEIKPYGGRNKLDINKMIRPENNVLCCGKYHEIIQWSYKDPHGYGAECSECKKRLSGESMLDVKERW